jgi:hypothetical protein
MPICRHFIYSSKGAFQKVIPVPETLHKGPKSRLAVWCLGHLIWLLSGSDVCGSGSRRVRGDGESWRFDRPRHFSPSSSEDAVLRAAVAFGGTISSEHGVGLAKVKWLPLMRNAADISAMQALKEALDPLGVLSPGRILPEPGRDRT